MRLKVLACEGLAEAARVVAGEPGAHILGGGTLLMRAVNAGEAAVRALVRVNDPALRAVRRGGEGVVIGAGLTMGAIISNRDTDFLAPAARAVGGPAVRNMATVGGNLFAAAPYGDFAAALLALDAVVVAADGSETPLHALLAGRERAPRPVVAAIRVKRPDDRGAFRFVKAQRVHPKGVSILSIAAHLPRAGGRVMGARVAYGAMGPTPVRAAAVERALEGRTLDAAGIGAAIDAAVEGLTPPDDAIASAWYRRQVAPVYLKRLLLDEGRGAG